MIRDLLAHPLARGLDIDAPSTTRVRQELLRKKAFLRKTYEEWYRSITRELPPESGPVLEIGSGAGFLGKYVPNLITSELFPVPGLSVVLNACSLPLAQNSLRAIVMTDVFHHIPDPCAFLDEAARPVRPGGRIIMIEPWNSLWARWVYTNLHHEPFRPDAATWDFPSTGPLSGANGALPWIVFERDKDHLLSTFPQWELVSVHRTMPFRYLLSGGVTYRGFVPAWTFPLWRGMEAILQPLSRHLAMFALIVLQRSPAPPKPLYCQSSANTFSS